MYPWNSNARNPARTGRGSRPATRQRWSRRALANHDLWRDVVAALEDQYRCITIDLPLGAHPWPLSPGADRSATSLAGLMLDCLELLEVEDATVVANDTAGGLLLLSLDSDHPALGRIGRLVLTNCDNYDQFPPDALKKAGPLFRRLPRLARSLMRFRRARRSSGAKASRPSPRADWTTNANSRSWGRCDAIDGWPMTWSRRRPGSAESRRRRRGDPAVRPARPVDLGRRVRLLPDGARAAARLRLPRRHTGAGSGSQGVGPDRQSGGGDRSYRRVRAGAGALIAGAGHGARERAGGRLSLPCGLCA